MKHEPVQLNFDFDDPFLENPPPLIYFKFHRSVVEIAIAHGLNATALLTFMCLGLDSNGYTGRSHPVDITALATYQKKKPHLIQNTLTALRKSGVVLPYPKTRRVYLLPSIATALKETAEAEAEAQLRFEFNDHPLGLRHFRCHRVVFEKSVKHHLNATAILTFAYLALNADPYTGETDVIAKGSIAAYLGKKVGNIRNTFTLLRKAELITPHESRRDVYWIPSIPQTRQETAARVAANREKAIQDAINRLIEIREAQLGRQLYKHEQEKTEREVRLKFMGNGSDAPQMARQPEVGVQPLPFSDDSTG